MKANNTNKYFLHFEAFFSNWLNAHFKDKNNFILLHPYKQTKNNLFYFSSNDKKNSVCRFNDIAEIKKDFFNNPIKHFNMELYEVNKNTYLKAINLLKNNDEMTKTAQENVFKKFYNDVKENFKNILV